MKVYEDSSFDLTEDEGRAILRTLIFRMARKQASEIQGLSEEESADYVARSVLESFNEQTAVEARECLEEYSKDKQNFFRHLISRRPQRRDSIEP